MQVVKFEQQPIGELMNMADAFAKSGMFQDIRSAAQAIVKIQAGQEIGIPPFAAMTGIHIIAGKPVIGAGIIASRVKGSGKYDYKITEQSDKVCSIDFYQGKELIGNSSFTIEEARKAGTKNLEKFPRNMLFARAISNGVKWFCPDVFNGPVYVPEEMGEASAAQGNATESGVVTDVTTDTTNNGQAEKPTSITPPPKKGAAKKAEDPQPEQKQDAPPPPAPHKQGLSAKAFKDALLRIENGEGALVEKLRETFILTEEQEAAIATIVNDPLPF